MKALLTPGSRLRAIAIVVGLLGIIVGAALVAVVPRWRARSRPAAAEPKAVAEPRCGDGSVDPGEECDVGIAQRQDCPDGWGACMTCMPSCTCSLVERSELVSDPYMEDLRVLLVRPPVRERREVKGYPDGELGLVTRYECDDKALCSTFAVDSDGDGRADHVTHYEYDAHGRRTRQWTTDASGKPLAKMPIETWRPRYDPNGNVLESVSGTEGAPEKDIRTTFQYDGAGRLSATEAHLPAGASAKMKRTAFTFDEHGRLSKRAMRWDGKQMPGFADEVFRRTKTGLVTAVELVVDDAIVARNTWTYEGGRLIRSAESYTGPPVNETSYEYDERGRLIRTRARTASEEGESVSEYDYDAAGRVSTIRHDADGDGRFDAKTELFYDEPLYERWVKSAPRRRPL